MAGNIMVGGVDERASAVDCENAFAAFRECIATSPPVFSKAIYFRNGPRRTLNDLPPHDCLFAPGKVHSFCSTDLG